MWISATIRANKYIDETAPWVLAKDESKKERLSTVLYNLSESIIICCSLLAPFMPDTAQKALSFFNASVKTYEEVGSFSENKQISVVSEPEKLFDRIDAKILLEKVAKMVEERKEKV